MKAMKGEDKEKSFADRGGRRQGTASYRSDNDAEREPGSGVTTVHGPRGERDRGMVVVSSLVVGPETFGAARNGN